MYNLFSRNNSQPITTITEEDEPMRIIFLSPTSPTKSLCVAVINSAETDNNSKCLKLYGSFKNRPALFRIPMQVSVSERYIDSLYNNGQLNLCSKYTTRIVDETTELLIVDFYEK